MVYTDPQAVAARVSITVARPSQVAAAAAAAQSLAANQNQAATKFVSPLVLVSDVSFERSTSYQLQLSLMQRIYLASFGEAPGSITIQGLAFEGGCDSSFEPGSLSLLNYYNQHSIAYGQDLIVVTIGRGYSLCGALVGMQMRASAMQLGATTYSLSIVNFPSLANQYASGAGHVVWSGHGNYTGVPGQ